MRRLFRLALILFCSIFISCVHNSPEEVKIYNVDIKQVTFKTYENIRDTNKIEYDFSICKFNGKEEAYINDFLGERLSKLLESKTTNYQLTESNIKDIAKNNALILKKSYEDIDDDFPFSDFYFYVSIDTVYHKGSLVTIQEKYENFTGGAHGSHNIYNFTFDLNKQSKLKFSDIFDKSELIPIAKDYFLKAEGITKRPVNLEEEGFWFENNQFYLPDNYFIEADTLNFIYNPYEISSYAEGYKYIKIPLDKIKELVKEKYKYILN